MDIFKSFLQSITSLSDEEFSASMQHFYSMQLNKGDYFVRQGQTCRRIGFVIKGLLRVYYLNEKAEEITSCFCTENKFTTSYKSFIDQKPSELSIQALEKTELLAIDYDLLIELYASSPTWQSIGRIITEQEYLTMEKYASVLNTETAKEKYLRLLNEQPDVIHRAQVEDIASYLGVTRRTLSRIRKELASNT